jgi:hypothetical protein
MILGLGADKSLRELHLNCHKEHFRCLVIGNRGIGESDKPVRRGDPIERPVL